MILKRIFHFLLICCFAAITADVGAQASPGTSSSAVEPNAQLRQMPEHSSTNAAVDNTPASDHLARDRTARREYAKFYSLLFSGLFIASLLLAMLMMRKYRARAEDVVLILGLNLVVFGTLIAVVILEAQEQLSAATGILGAIAGYLFGSNGRRGSIDLTHAAAENESGVHRPRQ